MNQAVLIYPHQLYAQHPLLQPDRLHILVEDPLYFGDARYPARFHKLKLMLHRASMKRYQAEVLNGGGLPSRYVDYRELAERPAALFEMLADDGCQMIHTVDPTDDVLERRIRRSCERYGLALEWSESPNFLTERRALDGYFDGSYHQTTFYIAQRKRLGILLDDEGAPVGGRWTYDTENRNKLKAGVTLPAEPAEYDNAFVREARQYVESNFPHNPGQSERFIYPTSHAEVEAVLHGFLAQKLANFGPYQDAISQRGDFLFHSLLSAPLNSGLLSPGQIVQAALAAYDAQQDETTLASIEGFVRQVIGWREFMRAVYVRDGVRQRNSNFFDNGRGLDGRWYDGTTGIAPLDDMIGKLNRTAYAHHIERLMIAGNLMTLCEIAPDEAYRWFMELFIDAYDWVMVPNLYGMSLYADGGLITTKPYISSSNYIRKMSDYKQAAWMTVWDGLYWRFIHKHRDFFGSNARLSMMTSHLRRMSPDALAQHQQTAEQFLSASRK